MVCLKDKTLCSSSWLFPSIFGLHNVWNPRHFSTYPGACRSIYSGPRQLRCSSWVVKLHGFGLDVSVFQIWWKKAWGFAACFDFLQVSKLENVAMASCIALLRFGAPRMSRQTRYMRWKIFVRQHVLQNVGNGMTQNVWNCFGINLVCQVQCVKLLDFLQDLLPEIEAPSTSAVSRREFEVSDHIRLMPHPCHLALALQRIGVQC